MRASTIVKSPRARTGWSFALAVAVLFLTACGSASTQIDGAVGVDTPAAEPTAAEPTASPGPTTAAEQPTAPPQEPTALPAPTATPRAASIPTPPAEADPSFDCEFLPSFPDDCISVVYRSDGSVVLESAGELPIEWAQLDCVYGQSPDACFVLELAGFGGSGNYGLGNSLTQAPTEALLAQCDGLGPINGADELACAELATRGVTPGTGGADTDASFDCEFLPSLPGDCISVIYRGDGSVVLETPSQLPVEWAQLDCVYFGSSEACFVLELAGFDAAGNYGLGNSLTQAPTEALLAQCDGLGPINGADELACAELATRGVIAGGGGADSGANDASFDCEFLPSLPEDCISVIYRGDGSVVLETPSQLPVEWAQLDCVYFGSSNACFVLELGGFDAAGNYGLGNSLSQAPADVLRQDCDGLGPINAADELACAELSRRG